MGSRSQDFGHFLDYCFFLLFFFVCFEQSLQLQVESLQRLCQITQQGGDGLSGSKMLLISSFFWQR